MSLLDKVGAPLLAYDKVMDWHIKHLDGKKRVSKNELLSRLRNRCNMEDLNPYNVRTVLPNSKVFLDIPCHNAGAMIRNLLTDPRIKDHDYLFFNDNPECPPPPDSECQELCDINTGLAYRRPTNS